MITPKHAGGRHGQQIISLAHEANLCLLCWTFGFAVQPNLMLYLVLHLCVRALDFCTFTCSERWPDVDDGEYCAKKPKLGARYAYNVYHPGCGGTRNSCMPCIFPPFAFSRLNKRADLKVWGTRCVCYPSDLRPGPTTPWQTYTDVGSKRNTLDIVGPERNTLDIVIANISCHEMCVAKAEKIRGAPLSCAAQAWVLRDDKCRACTV